MPILALALALTAPPAAAAAAHVATAPLEDAHVSARGAVVAGVGAVSPSLGDVVERTLRADVAVDVSAAAGRPFAAGLRWSGVLGNDTARDALSSSSSDALLFGRWHPEAELGGAHVIGLDASAGYALALAHGIGGSAGGVGAQALGRWRHAPSRMGAHAGVDVGGHPLVNRVRSVYDPLGATRVTSDSDAGCGADSVDALFRYACASDYAFRYGAVAGIDVAFPAADVVVAAAASYTASVDSFRPLATLPLDSWITASAKKRVALSLTWTPREDVAVGAGVVGVAADRRMSLDGYWPPVTVPTTTVRGFVSLTLSVDNERDSGRRQI